MKPKKKSWGEHLKPLALPSQPNSPLVSVLVANYNYGRFLGQALESVLNQTCQKFEIVVCDDGSTDESRDILTVYARKYGQLKVLFQDNQGQSEAILAAFRASCGRSFVFSTRTIPSCRLNSRNLSRLSCMRQKQALQFTG